MHFCPDLLPPVDKQARKSSEDAQAAGYTWFNFFWAGQSFGSKKFGPKIFVLILGLDSEKVEEKLRKLRKN